MCIEQDHCPRYNKDNPSLCENCEWKLQLDRELKEKEELELLNKKLHNRWRVAIAFIFGIFIVTTLLFT